MKSDTVLRWRARAFFNVACVLQWCWHAVEGTLTEPPALVTGGEMSQTQQNLLSSSFLITLSLCFVPGLRRGKRSRERAGAK